MRERTVEGALRDAVKAAGGECFKFVSPGRVGVPDRVIVLPGGVVAFIEVKAPGKVPTLQQARMLTQLKALGARAGWINRVEDVARLLNILRRK